MIYSIGTIMVVVQAPGGRPWEIYSIGTIMVVVVFQVLGLLAFLSNDPGSMFGLVQRLQLFTLQSRIAVLAGRLLIGPAIEPEPRPSSAKSAVRRGTDLISLCRGATHAGRHET